MIEVAYRETLIHSTEVVCEILAREEWLGCRHVHYPCLTYPGQHQCELSIYIFLDFKDIKTYMYYVFKSIRIIKEHW